MKHFKYRDIFSNVEGVFQNVRTDTKWVLPEVYALIANINKIYFLFFNIKKKSK